PLLVALTLPGADQLRDLRLHHLLHDPAQRLAQEVDALSSSRSVTTCSAVILFVSAHRGDSSRRRPGRPDESERHDGRTTRLRPTPSYTTPWDATLRLRPSS